MTDLRSTATAVLDALDPADVAELVSRRVDRDALLDAWCTLATRAREDLARRGVTVASDQERTLLMACLSLRPDAHAVKARADRAAQTYLEFLPLSHADPRDLVPVAADHPGELAALVPLLTTARRLRAGLHAAGVGDPPFFVEPVTLAVAASAEPTVDAARRVLERGAALAREHAASGRPVSWPGSTLPVVGNADYLVRLAGYRLALAGNAADMDELDRVAAAVGAEIAAAMERPTGFRARFRGAEPDVLAGVDRYVTGLGEAVGGEPVGRLLRLAYTVRTRRARPRRVEPAEHAPVERLSVPDRTGAHADREELAARLVAGLFERAEPRLRTPLLDWLCRRRLPDQQDELTDLVRMLRVAMHRMAEYVDGAAAVPVPTGLSAATFSAVLGHVTADVHPADLTGDRRSDAHRVAHLGLAPLWTRRRAAVRLLSAQRRALGLRGDTADRRTAWSRAGTRAPVQFFRPGKDVAPGRCCPQGAGSQPGRAPAADLVPCPHRPWGEIGVVDSYRTVAEDTDLSPDAVRKYYAGYTGPGRELLLGVRSTLRPEDC